MHLIQGRIMTNRLAESPSLYLRKHAENPIDWWPWCDAALEKARREDQPIFLSIGYSSCHWCTVMEGEAFSDPAIAAYMNANFLPIKVDREERPDLDSIYMQALQLMTGHGGWPLNVFLTPQDLVPFYGGTYFPVQPRYNLPGFLRLLQGVRQFYDAEKEQLETRKNQLLQHLQTGTILEPVPGLAPDLLLQGIGRNAQVLLSSGPGPRFPMIPYAAIALQGSRFELPAASGNIQAACVQRGMDLALGGIYDHVGGGFHRYTVDPTWTVPHFEKMLYDNGQIVEYLANLWSAGVHEPAFQRAIAGTVQWLQREMTAPAGYFYAAQDADSFAGPTDAEPEEGKFYVWSYSELEQLLDPQELTALQVAFFLEPGGNFEGEIVLQRQQPGELPPIVETALKQLFQGRYGELPEHLATFAPAENNQQAKTHPWPGRIPPVTDTKMIVAWNSLMISGLARAATVLAQPAYLELGARAAQFILDQQWQGGRLHRINYAGQVEVPAQSEDYALLIKALLDLHQASLLSSAPEPASFWLATALKVQAEFDQHLWAIEGGGYYNTARDASDHLLLRERNWMDNATPAANGVAIANLVRLFLLAENLNYLDQAEQALKTFGKTMSHATQGCPSLFIALDWYKHHTLIRTTPEQLAPLMRQQYLPTAVLVAADLPKSVVGLVCQGLTCQEPAQTPAQLWEQAGQSQTRSQIQS